MTDSLIPATALVYGMQLPVQSTSSIYAEAWELDANVDAIDAIARKADETGFFYLGVCDHTAIPRALQPTMGTQWYDTVSTLGYLAGITQKVRLLSHVYVVAHRHPLAVAKAFMTLDELSRGRVILGVGVGHLEAEFDALGRPGSDRGSRFRGPTQRSRLGRMPSASSRSSGRWEERSPRRSLSISQGT